MDWLSHFLSTTPVEGRLETRCLYGAPWQVIYEDSAAGEMPYHIVVAGEATLASAGGRVIETLGAGDIVVLAHGDAHVLHDGSGARPRPVKEHESLNLVVSENSAAGKQLDMLCGRFVVRPPHDRLIRAYLPPTLVVRSNAAGESAAADDTASRLAKLIELMRAEAAADSLGGLAMLNAFSAALFALTLRLASEAARAPAGLLALAGHPRLAPALTAMLRDPAHAWTLPELAERCHMSRATLARHFQERVGRSASDLLTDIRMNLALRELARPGMSTEAVAEAVGYQSLSAFKKVFKQRTGATPAEWRRQRAGRVAQDDAAAPEPEAR
jgi:AraC family transcriptional activator of mtrCDE